jgi:hypothetical protein
MSPESPDPQIVGAFERRPAIPADRTQAILAHQRLGHRLPALGAIESRVGLWWWFHLTIIAVSLTGCLRLQTGETAIGEAYVAPATLQLREEIAPRAKVTATLHHGARVEILERRRRFAKARVPGGGGASGWTDGRQLLSAEGMALFQSQSARAQAVPPQGSAFAADVLNLHITPYRGAPSFHQLAEGDRVSLAARSIVPRIQYVPPEEAERPGQPAPPPETLRDDWSLVCLPDRRCGWVLTGMLMLDLPDEVIQLAEGHRITAFFTLGHTLDAAGKERPVYLWTTSAVPPAQVQFDAFRVFVWNAARERYERAHSERGLRGLHPVIVEGNTVRLVYATGSDGAMERHAFEFRGRKLHRISREPWVPPGPPSKFAGPLPDGAEGTGGAWARVSGWVRSWWR